MGPIKPTPPMTVVLASKALTLLYGRSETSRLRPPTWQQR